MIIFSLTILLHILLKKVLIMNVIKKIMKKTPKKNNAAKIKYRFINTNIGVN